jgi:hypothetical protein
MLSGDLPASSNKMHLILSQEARIALEAVALSPVMCVPAWLKIDPHINNLTFFNA